MMSKQYKSEALAAVHETALGLNEAGVMDRMTMKMFDEMCLIPAMEMGTDISAHIDSPRSRFTFPVSPLTPRKELPTITLRVSPRLTAKPKPQRLRWRDSADCSSRRVLGYYSS